MSKELEIMKRVQEHLQYLQSKGYEVVFIALQGSQNYGLDIYTDEYMSDVDTKAVVLPSFEDFVKNRKPISTTIILENNEHIDVKDIREMFNAYKKQNINYIETLFTKYKIINAEYADLIEPLFENREQIAHLNFNQALRCIAGMSMEKMKAMEHPYPNLLDKIEKYGYDPKQLHHIARMCDFIQKYVSGKSYEECLVPDENTRNYLIEIKTGKFQLGIARDLAKKYDSVTKAIKDSNSTKNDVINENAIELLEKVKYDVLKHRFKKEINKEE